jgi:hypothetical protein
VVLLLIIWEDRETMRRNTCECYGFSHDLLGAFTDCLGE